MNNVLRIERDRLALEASLSLDLTALLQNTLPSIIAGFGSLIGRFSPDEPAVPLTSKEQDFVKEVSKHSYLNVVPLAAYVPEGMNVSYLKYLHALVPAVQHAAQFTPKHLNDFSMYLSQLISNGDQRLSSVSFKREHGSGEKMRKQLNQALGKCFRTGSTRSEVSIGDVVERNADWMHVFKQNTEQVIAINGVDRKQLNRKVTECSELLSVVMDKIDRGEFTSMSPQTVTNIAEGAYSAAEEVEFYAAIHYKSMAFAQALTRTVAHFRTVFKH